MAEEVHALKEKSEHVDEVISKVQEKVDESDEVSKDKEDCIFCKIVRGEIPCERVYEDKNFIGFLDINPKAEGHTLIVSKNHYKTMLDVADTLGNELVAAIKQVGLKLLSDKKGEGLNLAVNIGEASGQLVPHFHAHIVPRKKGDGLNAIA